MRCLLAAAFLLSICTFSWAQENVVNKQEWIAHMQKALPPAFCEEKQYFRQCFKVTQQECLDTTAAVTRQCINKKENDIPEVLVQPRDGSHWGGIVGECAGDAYEKKLLDRRIDSDRCNDVKNWI